MIEISLPLRPRTDIRAEYLVTGISVFSSTGIPVLNLTTMNFSSVQDANQARDEYVQLYYKLFRSNSIISIEDRHENFIKYAKYLILKSNIYMEECECLICECKKYEELSTIKAFNQRRVTNGICSYCNSSLTLHKINALFLKVDWSLIYFDSFNYNWVKDDWLRFQKKQDLRVYKVSKEIEPVSLIFDCTNFGIKHQLLWACQIVYAAKIANENEVRIHFVEKIKDLVFFICSIVKVLNPKLSIHLKGCPVVWLEQEKKMYNITVSDIEKIKKGLNSKRKRINVQ